MKYINSFLAVLAIVMLTSCGGNSTEKDVTYLFNGTWNAKETLNIHDDGSITYYSVQWGGIAARMIDDGEPVNWAGYNKIVFVFKEPVQVGTQIMINNKIKAWGSPGITSLECSLEGYNETVIERLAMQTAAPTKIEIERIYLSQESVPNSSMSIWAGECIFGEWNNGVYIAPEYFEDSMEGDHMELVYDVDTSDPSVKGWQFKAELCNIGQVLEGSAADQNEWGCVTVDKASKKHVTILTANDVDLLKKYGLFIGGYHLIMRQVILKQK